MDSLDPQQPFARYAGRSVSLETFHRHACAVAADLPESRYVVNLCEDRYRFAVGFAAAMARRQLTLLPTDRSVLSLRSIDTDFPNALLITDGPTPAGDGQPVFRIDLPVDARMPRSNSMLPADGAETVVVAFTSGSTGTPEAHPKTWGTLSESARLIGSALEFAGRSTVIATVPAQHMYGLELSVLVPMVCGLVLDASKPFFPEDIARALQEAPEPRVLVTTPAHLRVLAASPTRLPGLDLIVSATAPLAPGLAAECEKRFGARVLEIYGCTEAGSIASRRTVADSGWTLFDTVRLAGSGSRCRVEAPHLAHSVELADIIEPLDEHRFELKGRTADLVNIAGKRHSLAALNRVLTDIEGVVDGAFFIPNESENARPARPVAVVVAPGRTAEHIVRSLRAKLDPVFVPRIIHLVDALPRNETGKLTRQALEDLIRTRAQGISRSDSQSPQSAASDEEPARS